jgi:hypothetical protein
LFGLWTVRGKSNRFFHGDDPRFEIAVEGASDSQSLEVFWVTWGALHQRFKRRSGRADCFGPIGPLWHAPCDLQE